MSKYLQQTRTLSFSLLAISPLLLVYESSIARYNENHLLVVRNAAEVYIKNFFHFLGLTQPWQLGLVYVLITLAVFIYARKKNRELPKVTYWFAFLIESIAYAAFFGTVTHHIAKFITSLQVTAPDASADTWMQVLLALAAGVYEELLFRLFFVGSLFFLFKSLLPAQQWIQAILASGLAALLFALFHYQTIELVQWDSFVFRMVAGFILGLLFLFRGLGVAVYTHALYDLFFLYRMS